MNARRLAALKMLATSWPGSVEGGQGLVHMINPSGHRPPLIWVFNAETEFRALSETLGPDQPVIGLRSLNLIVPYSDMRVRDQDELGRHYGEILSPILSGRPCFVGGNCQAAHISCAIAAHFLTQAQPVLGLLSIDAENLLPLPIPYAAIFGEFSQEFNPCLKGANLFPLWHRAFREVSPRTLPAGHGEYFTAPSLSVLAAHVSSFIDHYHGRLVQPQASRGQHALCSKVSLPPQMRTGESVFVSHPDGVRVPGDILARWHDHQNPSLIMRAHPVRGDTTGAGGFDLLAPDTPGAWELQLFRCQIGIGPVHWAADIRQSRLIQIDPA
ncbi:hypothetical protein IQ24_03790 [Paracoccus sulfuroxidans]|uniref:Uncharacterized protein n=2 Tax=Paracoccus sulfuroxidans TaxID=384678 RepID=A0A562N7T9_9RHOB|nr:hypothetical protein IQ24_03790 [Paracoccus sulfuroxidans]